MVGLEIQGFVGEVGMTGGQGGLMHTCLCPGWSGMKFLKNGAAEGR
jgi:hypothetical protein